MSNRINRITYWAGLVGVAMLGLSTTSSAAPATTTELVDRVRSHLANRKCEEIAKPLAADYLTLRRDKGNDPLSLAEHINAATILAYCLPRTASNVCPSPGSVIFNGITPTSQPEIENQRALNTIGHVFDRDTLADPSNLTPVEVDALRAAVAQLNTLSATRTFKYLGNEHIAEYKRLREQPPDSLSGNERDKLDFYDAWYRGTFLVTENKP